MIYLDYAATNPFTKYPCSKYGQFLNPNANYAYKEQKLLDDCANSTTVSGDIGLIQLMKLMIYQTLLTICQKAMVK